MLTPDEIAEAAKGVREVMARMDTELRARAAKGIAAGEPREVTQKALSAIARSYAKPVAKAVRSTFEINVKKGMARDEAIYAAARAAGLIGPYVPLADAVSLTAMLTKGITGAQSLANIVGTSALAAVSSEFTAALDLALMQVGTGVLTHEQAVRAAVKTIAEMVPHVTYKTAAGEYVNSTIYTAVDRAVTTGLNQTTLRIQEARMRDLNATKVEISAHAGARPEHAEWQGTVIDFADLEAVTGYGEVDGLGGANCRHSFSPYFDGISEPTDYSWLDDRDAEADYELSQRQRTCERNVRTYAARSEVYRAAGFPDEAARNDALAEKWRRETSAVAKQRSGAVRSGRMQVYPGEERMKGK